MVKNLHISGILLTPNIMFLVRRASQYRYCIRLSPFTHTHTHLHCVRVVLIQIRELILKYVYRLNQFILQWIYYLRCDIYCYYRTIHACNNITTRCKITHNQAFNSILMKSLYFRINSHCFIGILLLLYYFIDTRYQREIMYKV